MGELSAQAFCAIQKHQMIKNGDTVIVACSGGADSVALFHFLFACRETLGISLRAAHVNHGLRGADSDADAAFVARLCEQYQVPLDIAQLTPPFHASEAWGREQRYAFFSELSARFGGAKIATAHTLNDNAETVLLHLARGAGLDGAAGIPAVRGTIIRPLLQCSRAEVEAYLAENALAHITDATNETDAYARNRVRKYVLPALEQARPGATAALTRFAEHATEATEYLHTQAEALLQSASVVNAAEEQAYYTDILTRAPAAVRKAALRALIVPYADATLPRLSQAEQAVLRGRGAVQISKNVILSAAQGMLHFEPVNGAPIMQWTLPFSVGKFSLPDGGVLWVERLSYEEFINFQKEGLNPLKSVADYDKIIDNAIFRTRRAGDRFRTVGTQCHRPLKKLYNEAKISVFVRTALPVLAAEESILWAAGIGFADGLAPDASTKIWVTIKSAVPKPCEKYRRTEV